MNIVNQVQCTNDHSIFKIQIGNRPINTNHVARLVMSMQKSYLMSPLIVNENMEVIDGQHRLTAQKELKLPTYFIENKGYGLKETRILNQNSKNWTADDFMNGYVNMGNENYLQYKKFKKLYRFGHHECQKLIGGFVGDNIKTGEVFRTGQMKITHNQSLAGCRLADMIYMIKPYYAGFKRRNFVYALLILFKNPDYDHSVFISRLSKQTEALTDQARTDQYISLIEKIYNHRSRSKIRLH